MRAICAAALGAAAAASGAAWFEAARRRRLERERERFFSLSWDPMGVFDLAGRALELNSSWERTLGFSPEELKAGRLAGFAHPDDRRAMERELAELAAAPAAAAFQNRFECKGGAYKRLSWAIRSAPEEGRLYAVARDIGERAAADEAVSLATHELRAPLTSIAWGLDLLANEPVLTGKALEVVKLSHGSALRMTRIIDDYLDVVKIESGSVRFSLRPLDLTALTEAAVRAAQPLASSLGVSLELRRDAAGARVEADPERLTQALTILLSNAAEFSPRGGAVSVALERRGGKNVRVSVLDQGPRIPDDLRESVFRKFAKARAPGLKRKESGLSLSIAKAVVEALQGRIGLETDSAAGTTFFIELPELPA